MNKIQRNIYSKVRGIRRIAPVLALILALAILVIPTDQVYAESLALSVNKSTVKIGEKVTVSITVPGGISATVNLVYSGSLLEFESASETANANGGTVSMTLGGYGGTNTPTTGTVTFEAKTAGTAQFSVTAPVAGNQEGDQVALDGARATVTIQNESNEPPTGNGGNGGNGNNTGEGGGNGNNTGEGSGGGSTTRKSADNSLKVLELSSGTLSPEFKYNTVNYTATVENSVTSVAVNARTSNAKATITSVEGGENLKVGENKIRISVQAENGVVAVYTITVTRKAEAAGSNEGQNNPPDNPQPIDPQPVDPTGKSFEKDGKKLYMTAEIPAAVIPAGYTASETTLGGQSYPCLADTFAGGKMRLLYLTDANGTDGRLYLLSDSSEEKIYDFVNLRSENGFVIALPEGEGGAPKSFAMETCTLEEKGSIDVWYAGEEKDFPIFYGVNQAGAGGWYRLDKKELTYMRYVQQEETGKPSNEKPAQTDDSRTEINRLKTQNALIIGIAAIIVIMLLIVIAFLILQRGKSVQKKDEDLEFINIFKDN